METPKFEMPVVGWVYLGIGVLLLLLTFVLRGMKFSGLMASLTFLLCPASLYAFHWYVTRYVASPEAKQGPGPFDLFLLSPDTGPVVFKGFLIGMGVLGGLFFLCMLEAGINYRRAPQKERERRYAGEDNPFGPAPVVPPPLPGTRPQARPAPGPLARPAPGTAPPQGRKPPAKRPGPPRGNQNPFDFA